MANLARLNVPIGTNLAGLRSGLGKASKMITSFGEGIETKLGSVSLGRLDSQIQNISSSSLSSVPAANKLAGSLKKVQRPAANTTSAVVNFNRVIQDAPFGIIGVANNLEPLISSFNQLRATTGSTAGAFKSLLSSAFTGPGALITVVSVVSSLLLVFRNRLSSTKKETDELSDSMKTLNSKWQRTIELQKEAGAFEDDQFGIKEANARIREITEDIEEYRDQLDEINKRDRERRQIIAENTDLYGNLTAEGQRQLDVLDKQFGNLQSQEQVQKLIQNLQEERQRISEELVSTADALADSDTRQAQESAKITKSKEEQAEFERQIAEARQLAREFQKGEDVVFDADIDIPEVELDLGDRLFPKGSLGELKQRLEDAQDALDMLTPNTEAFDRQQKKIADLQGQIDGLENQAVLASDAVKMAFQAMSDESIDSFEALGKVVVNTTRKIVAAEIAAGIATSVKKALTEVPFPFNIAAGAAAGAAAAGLFNAIVPKFHDGGIIPGPIGQERLVMVKGGETVLPTHKRAMNIKRTVTVPVYLNNRQIAMSTGEYEDTLSR